MTNTHHRPQYDFQGETLDHLSKAHHYNRWIFEMMKPHLGQRILEIGCGIGNITGMLAGDRRKVLAVDINSDYLSKAKARWNHQPNISFRKIRYDEKFSRQNHIRPDTIVCVNILEHIQKEESALKEYWKTLPPGGRLLIFVPALPSLFGSMDASYGHFRRYHKTGLQAVVAKAGFEVTNCRYLNLLGILGWWWNGKILKKSFIPENQIGLYNLVIRIIRPIEKWLPKPIGLSLFCVGRKPSSDATAL
jgi:2-polyprenyl-3-methyl-5-hydroxy-6-metoxy-1,4-benzoquinol methylase